MKSASSSASMGPSSVSSSASPENAKSQAQANKDRCLLIELIPSEMQLSIITHLRATDLSALQRTCRHFNSRTLIRNVIEHISQHVYPPELTDGFDTPIVGGEVSGDLTTSGGHLTYEALRNMEMLVTVRILSRPEPPLREREHGFYVSKHWCRTALQWLDAQQERREEERRREEAERELLRRNPHASLKKKRGKKLSKKEQKKRGNHGGRSRKMSETVPPPCPNVNDDIICPHNELARCSSKSARARRRVLDKQAWRVLKKLYPDSVQLSSAINTECVQCALEAETAKRTELDKKEREKEERKRPLSCPVVRGIYTRNRGVPPNCLVAAASNSNSNLGDDVKIGAVGAFSTPKKSTHTGVPSSSGCPLLPGVYNALPRSWCHTWRRYLKTGEGDRPLPPDASALLCDAHRLPLVPPHLESFLYGETSALLICSLCTTEGEISSSSPFAVGNSNSENAAASSSPFSAVPVGYNPVVDESGENAADASAAVLRAATGMSELELQSQRLAMLHLERQQRQQNHHREAIDSVATPQTPQRNLRRNSSQENLAVPAAAAVASPDVMSREAMNEQLDRENYRVVEILTDEEFAALERWWPEIHSSYALRFAITADDSGGGSTGGSSRSSVVWSTPPCRECDASGKQNAEDFGGRRLTRARRIRRHGHVANGKGR